MHELPHLLFAASWLAGLAAQAGELPGVRAATAEAVQQLGLRGAGLAVVRAGERLHTSLHGNLTADAALPIASASKWLAVATVLAMVDAGELDLDLPVGRYVAEFDRPDRQGMTLRQCLANTTGLPARLGDLRDADMAAFAAAAADVGLRSPPGASFRYGGVGFQVAAVAAERVSGKNWHTLFAERIAGPLGMTKTKFGTLLPPGGEAGTARLPWVAGGAVSTLDDYAAFVGMLLAKGRVGERRVLSEASVAAMLRDQVPENVAVDAVGFEADGVRYGLGTWIVPIPGEGVPRASDPGAFGFTPWLDVDLGIGGVFAVRDRVGRVMPKLERVQAVVRDAVRSPAVAGSTTTVALEHGGRDRRYHLHVPPHPQGHPGLPLLLVLHGGGGNGEQVREATGLAAAGVRAGFVVVFPDGTGPLRGKLLTWNSGGIAVYAQEHDVDDVGFLRAVVADVARRAPIDLARVFAAGHSNGGMMCHRLARQAADVFAGIAVVAGAMNFTATAADRPIAVLLVHGSADDHVRIEGGRPRAAIGRAGDRTDTSLAAAVEYYCARNELTAAFEKVVEGKVRTETWSVGARPGTPQPVRVITLDGGGHAWPGSSARLLADTPFPFDASAAILAFFRDLPAR